MARAVIDPLKKRPLLSIEEEDPDNLEGYVHRRAPTDRATLENLDETFEEQYEDEDSEVLESHNKAPIRRFGTQMGLFSKFTNAPTLDEFTLAGLLAEIEDRPKEEEEQVLAPPPPQLQSIWSFRGSIYDSDLAQEILAKKTEHKSWYKASIIAVIFSTQFAGALELVYISPLFTRMVLPPLIDATVWIFPVMFITLVTPFINIFSSHLRFERTTHILMMIFSIIGCLLFSFLDQFLPAITHDPEEQRVLTIYFGFLAFCLLDVSNEMTILIQNKIVQADEILGVPFNTMLSGVASVAKTLAYLLGSLEAFGVDFSRGIIPRNLDVCFLVAAIILFTSLVLTALYQTAPTKGYRGPITKKLKQLKPAHFLPPVRRIFKGTPNIKLLVSSHFFGSAGMLMLAVYVTIWAGSEIFEGDGRAAEGSEDYNNFKTGVAWGSFSLFLGSILSGCTKYFIFKATQPQNLSKAKIKALYLWSLFLAALITIICQYTGSKNWWFLLLSLTGPAMETFHVLPGILGDLAEIKDTGKHLGHYRHLLSFSLFYAQVLMFLVVPLFFLLEPDRDDNLWGMLAAAASTLVAAIIGWFL